MICRIKVTLIPWYRPSTCTTTPPGSHQFCMTKWVFKDLLEELNILLYLTGRSFYGFWAIVMKLQSLYVTVRLFATTNGVTCPLDLRDRFGLYTLSNSTNGINLFTHVEIRVQGSAKFFLQRDDCLMWCLIHRQSLTQFQQTIALHWDTKTVTSVLSVLSFSIFSCIRKHLYTRLSATVWPSLSVGLDIKDKDVCIQTQLLFYPLSWAFKGSIWNINLPFSSSMVLI